LVHPLLELVRRAGPAASAVLTKMAIEMGDDLTRELGQEIVRQLPH
jgi:hypothetical protein